MKNVLSRAILLLLILAGLGAPDLEKRLEWQKAIVYLNYHSKSVTSGFFVSEGIIVAPFHLIQDWVIFVDGFHIFAITYRKDKFYKTEIIGYNQSADLLFLRILGYKAEFWFSEFEYPKAGDDCFVLGYPKGWQFGKRAKVITHFRSSFLGIDIIPVEGASGSAVISEKGKIFGMLTKRFGYAIITPGIKIQNGLKLAKKEK